MRRRYLIDKARDLGHRTSLMNDKSTVLARQTHRISERRRSDIIHLSFHGLLLEVWPGVYQTGADTDLMVSTAAIKPGTSLLEIGAGVGAIGLAIGSAARKVVLADINEIAVRNCAKNIERIGYSQFEAIKSDVFENVTGRFDTIVFNPPLTDHPVVDAVDRMFWDPDGKSKIDFFGQVGKYLEAEGKIYFGWATFEGLDCYFPVKEAEKNGFRVPDRGSVNPSPLGDGSYFSPQGRHSVFEEASAELKVDGIGKLEQPEITGYRPHGRSIRLTAVTRSHRLLAGGHSH
jgi:release factor glutamine methyltransferase